MSYIALRSLKVQKPDGKMDLRAPGDPVPEAAKWKDVDRWVRRGWIAETDPATIKTKKGTPRKKSVPAKLKETVAAVPEAPAPEPEPAPTGPTAPLSKDELAKLTKVQLITVGLKYGVSLSESSLKEELIEEVLKASGE